MNTRDMPLQQGIARLQEVVARAAPRASDHHQLLDLVLAEMLPPVPTDDVAVVALCLAPFRTYEAREVGYVGWVGLRGAVPIVLATYPVLAGAPGAARVFDVVFFVVVVNALVPGATVPWLTRRLGLESGEPPLLVLALEDLGCRGVDVLSRAGLPFTWTCGAGSAGGSAALADVDECSVGGLVVAS